MPVAVNNGGSPTSVVPTPRQVHDNTAADLVSDDTSHVRSSAYLPHVEGTGRDVPSPKGPSKRPRREVQETARLPADENREKQERLRDELETFDVLFQASDQPFEYDSSCVDRPSTRVEEGTASEDDIESLFGSDESAEQDESAMPSTNQEMLLLMRP